MTNSDKITTSPLNQAIVRYATALSEIEQAAPNPTLEQVLEVMTARDAVKAARSAQSQTSGENLSKLIYLDSRLKQQAAAIASDNKLDECRQSLEPADTDWWWFLEPPASPSKPQPKWSQFDWVWNTLTVACLVGATTFGTSTIKAFSHNGFDLLQTFGTITQGAGLALVARGTLTDKGQQAVKNALESLNIPKYLHAEATFAASAVFLGASYGIHASLPELGEHYYLKGQESYNKGQLAQALKFYTEADQFAPDLPNLNVAIGRIHETLGEYEQATSYYEKGLIKGNPASFNGVGRVLLEMSPNDPEAAKKAELYFLLGLKESPTPELQARLHANLGLALLRQQPQNTSPSELNARLSLAKDNFDKALQIEKELPNTTPGWGVASCYLMQLAQAQNALEEGEKYQKQCEVARPETIGEYKAIIDIGGEKLGEIINTTGIVSENKKESQFTVEQAKVEETQALQETFQPDNPVVASNAGGDLTVGESVSSPLEITDPLQLEEAQNLLYKKIDETWVTYPSFEKPLVYRVKVTESGAIASYEPTDKLAADFVNEIPLPTLPKSTNINEAVAEFTVTFTPAGKLEVSQQSKSDG